MTAKTANQIIERPPVIAIMGHIDHGKSTLLDYIRKTNVVDKEAGGITQHVSAYEVDHKSKKITFLDTPGHAAFETIRERSAAIADIAVLIVSAEEGVKAQTLEALRSITEAGIPYIVAINKIDRPNANPDRTKQSLSENNIFVESYGGKIPSVNISAKTGEGVDELLDMMIIVSELEELTGNASEMASGFTLEANMDPKIGTTVTLVIKDGTLDTGDFLVIGTELAKVKRLEDFLGKTITTATFSSPVRVFGFTTMPPIGGEFKTFKDKKAAEKYLEELKSVAGTSTNSETEATDRALIPVVIKADVNGTLEAVKKELASLALPEIGFKILQSGIGPITEGDVKMATASEAPIILGFNVKTDSSARDLAERGGITIQTFDIIYKLGEWMAEIVKERKPRVTVHESVGKAKIIKIFSQTKDKQVLGGQVLDGKLLKGREVKILRRDNEIGRGEIVELQEQKVKATAVEAGAQFGAMIESKVSIAAGDVIEVFDVIEK